MVADIPADARTRVEWLKYKLRVRGWTVSSLAMELGVHQTAVSHGLRVGSEKIERAVAQRLGLFPRDIWPERYDRRGTRIRKRPGPKPGGMQR